MRTPPDKIKIDKKQFWLFFRFAKLLFPYRLRWAAILFLSGAGALLGLVNPYLAKLVIDKAIGDKDLRVFIILTALGATIFVVTGVLNGFKQYLERYVEARIRFDLNKKVFKCVQCLPFRWFQNKSTGEHLYKISYDISRVENLITTIPPQAVALFPKLLVILFIILRLNWKMAIFSLCLVPFLYLPPYYFIRKRRVIWERLIKNSEQIFKMLHETFSHIYAIKIFGKERFEIRRYLKKLIGNIRIELSSTRLEIFNIFFAKAVDKVIIGLIALYGGYQVIIGTMSLGTLTAILVYLGQLVVMQSSFVSFFERTVLGLVSCQRVAGILDEKDRVVCNDNTRDAVFKKGEIVFDRISFRYSEKSPILRNLSFSIPADQHVSLAAPSGFGKTTLLNLIVRLYDPLEGDILIDGIKIQNVRLNSLREQIGVVLQEPYLFSDTIKNNILYGKQKATGPEILEIARLSLVDDFVKDLPDEYETIIGENGCKLSEGQKQKIAIARALIKRPRILIMDEAMSSMDSTAEEKIISNIKQNLDIMTLITVSHRLSTVKSADLIYFLKRPDKIVTDTYQELIKNDGEFYNLFADQLV